MTALLAAACAAAAAGLLCGPSSGAHRARRISGTGDRFPAAPAPSGHPVGSARAGRPGAGARAAARQRRLRLPAALLAGSALALLVGGAGGVLAGGVAALGLHRWLAGLESRQERRRRALIAAELPIAADLLAACLAAGSAFDAAADAVADAVAGPLGEALRTTVATLRLGGDPARCWRDLERDPGLAPLGRELSRAARSGAPVAAAVARLADDQRRARRWAAEAVARSVGVRAMAPLGLCFLPAFVLLAIVPVVAGIAGTVLPALS